MLLTLIPPDGAEAAGSFFPWRPKATQHKTGLRTDARGAAVSTEGSADMPVAVSGLGRLSYGFASRYGYSEA